MRLKKLKPTETVSHNCLLSPDEDQFLPPGAKVEADEGSPQ
jgi:hypothetical protein